MEHWRILTIIGIILLAGIFFLGFLKTKAQKRRQKLFQKKIQKFLEKIRKIPESHYNQKILEYDKVLDTCLYEKLGSRGKNLTTGGKMKKFGTQFHNETKIWSAHKLRNTIAHEIGFQVSTKKFLEAEKTFLEEIQKIIQ